jgi:biotin synthase
MAVEDLVEGARKAKAAGAWKYCMVTATRGPSNRDLDVICGAAREAGIDRFNHNLETSRRLYSQIVSTHTYDDRIQTAHFAREAGMEICSGGIIGLGEENEDILELCYNLREIGAASIPVNFLDPRPGTPLAERPRVEPFFALRVLCLFRFVHPEADVRAAGGREATFRSLQPLVLFPANSIFTNGYLTTPGQGESADHQMIRDMGMEPQVVAFE